MIDLDADATPHTHYFVFDETYHGSKCGAKLSSLVYDVSRSVWMTLGSCTVHASRIAVR